MSPATPADTGGAGGGGADLPPPAPLSEEEVPLIGVGRVEFHRGLDRLERATHNEGSELRNTLGWTLVFIGFYVALGGWTMTTRTRKGKVR